MTDIGDANADHEPPHDLIGNGVIFDRLHRHIVIHGGKSQGRFQSTVYTFDLSTAEWHRFDPPSDHIMTYIPPLTGSATIIEDKKITATDSNDGGSGRHTDRISVDAPLAKHRTMRPMRKERKRVPKISLFKWMKSVSTIQDHDDDMFTAMKTAVAVVAADETVQVPEKRRNVFGLKDAEESREVISENAMGSSSSAKRNKSVIRVVGNEDRAKNGMMPRPSPLDMHIESTAAKTFDLVIPQQAGMSNGNDNRETDPETPGMEPVFSLDRDSYVCLHGNANLERMYHSCSYIRELDKMIVFGGGGGVNSIFLNDVWQYDLATHQWEQLSPCIDVRHEKYPQRNIPTPRNLHSACVRFLGYEGETIQSNDNDNEDGDDDYDNEMNDNDSEQQGEPIFSIVIFGGWNGSLQAQHNDTFEFNIKDRTWRVIDPILKKHGPTHRSAHTAEMISRDKMLVFGGKHNGCRLNDTWVYDLKRRYWEQLVFESSNEKPPPRAGHASSLLGSGEKLLIQGGKDIGGRILFDAFVLHIRLKVWQRVDLSVSPLFGVKDTTGVGLIRRCFHRIFHIDEFQSQEDGHSIEHPIGSYQLTIVGGLRDEHVQNDFNSKYGGQQDGQPHKMQSPVVITFSDLMMRNDSKETKENAEEFHRIIVTAMKTGFDISDVIIRLQPEDNASTEKVHPKTDTSVLNSHSLVLTMIPIIKKLAITARNHSEWDERTPVEITIPANNKVFSLFLHFLMGEIPTLGVTMAFELLDFINQFLPREDKRNAIVSVMMKCIKLTLASSIRMNSVADILPQAKAHGLTEIVNDCYLFLYSHISIILENEDMMSKLSKSTVVEILWRQVKPRSRSLDRFYTDRYDVGNQLGSALHSAVVSETKKHLAAEVKTFQSLSDATAWLKQSLCDVILQGDGSDTCITAHRTILALRCEYLQLMLTREFMESKSDCVRMEGMSPTVVCAIVQYIYGQVDFRLNTMNDLLVLIRQAGMMLLPVLKKEAIRLLIQSVTYDTAMQVLEFAMELELDDVKAHCLEM